jgi:hypothetical protein
MKKQLQEQVFVTCACIICFVGGLCIVNTFDENCIVNDLKSQCLEKANLEKGDVCLTDGTLMKVQEDLFLSNNDNSIWYRCYIEINLNGFQNKRCYETNRSNFKQLIEE